MKTRRLTTWFMTVIVMLSMLVSLTGCQTASTVPEHLQIPNYSEYMKLGNYKGLQYTLLNTYKTDEDRNNAIFDAVMIEIMNNSQYNKYPEDQITRLIAIANETVEVYAANNGVSVEDFLKSNYGFESAQAYQQYVRLQAQSYFEVRMTIFEIARLEKMTVSQEEFDKARQELFSESGLNETDFATNYTNEDVLFRVLYPKVQAFLVANSSQIQVAPVTESTAASATTETTTAPSATGKTQIIGIEATQ